MVMSLFESYGIDPSYVMIGLAVMSIVLLVLVIVSLVKLGNVKKKYNEFMRGKDGKGLEDTILKRFDEFDEMTKITKKNSSDIKAIFSNLQIAYQKMGIVKYDAFNEMGGKLSFAFCLLDKDNNGMILNAMHSREGCYTYIKEIVNGGSYIVLADEERQALEEALGNKTNA